jgi:signal peptidase
VRRALRWLAAAGLGLVALTLAAAWIGGWEVSVVQTSSMAPGVPRNSVALVRRISPDGATVGDVIAFREEGGGSGTILHRVTRVIDDERRGRLYETRGDANDAADPELVPARAVTGRMVWHAAHLGAVVARVEPPWTFAVLVGLPLIVLVLSEAQRRVRDRTLVVQGRGSATAADASPLAAWRADWYADPLRRFELRYWDGSRWTEHVATRGTAIDPFTPVLGDPHASSAGPSG